MQVQILNNPTTDEFRRVVDSFQPNFVYLQGEQLPNDEVGSLVWEGVDLSTAEAISGFFTSSLLPTTVSASAISFCLCVWLCCIIGSYDFDLFFGLYFSFSSHCVFLCSLL